MEINTENIDAIKEKDAQLQDVLAKMKPGSVLQMIREGINPLTISIDELQEILNGKNETIADTLDDYSHFLAKLDRKGDILAEERSVYIGIYRLLRQIEKGESAAVGSLLNAEMNFSLGNLLTALRSTRRQGMEYAVNDDFGSISASKSHETLEASLEKLHQAMQPDDDSRREPQKETSKGEDYPPSDNGRAAMREIIAELKLDENDEKYLAGQLKDIRAIKGMEDEIIQTLLDSKQPITVNNLVAIASLMKKPGQLAGKADEYAKETDLDKIFAGAKEDLIDNFTDEDQAVTAYDNLQKVMTDIFTKAATSEQATSLDVKELSSMCRQINLQAAMRVARINVAGNETYREERYDIPVEIDGEITAVNLLLRHSFDTGGKVSCAMTSAAFGVVNAEFDVKNGIVQGHIAGNDAEGLKKLGAKADNLYATLNDILINQAGDAANKIGDIYFIQSNAPEASLLQRNENILTTEEQDERKDADKVSSKELYLVAKAFITFVQRTGKESQ
jgi:hypothetical protein